MCICDYVKNCIGTLRFDVKKNHKQVNVLGSYKKYCLNSSVKCQKYIFVVYITLFYNKYNSFLDFRVLFVSLIALQKLDRPRAYY